MVSALRIKVGGELIRRKIDSGMKRILTDLGLNRR